ncbi:hypothetical protein [Aquimarina intermedia]|uniref:Viral A-type inclusion protein n=1 Tax=Aquimarina intermedia TaxID=350814 RepID=A0A5S5C307_9FLAO|nr:hypothetical protein [Aquimarina intermedia]TYP72806.1 hypothetical protein BD809_10654 [Aquimarina intermedia]
MTKLSNLVFILTALLLTYSCDSLSKEEEAFDKKMQEIIDVHDEVMPKMGEMSALIKNLESKIDTTNATRNYKQAQQNLKDGYDFMMEWMSDFSQKFPHDDKNKELSNEELNVKMKILEQEEVEVKELRDQINSSIQNAKSVLKITEEE